MSSEHPSPKNHRFSVKLSSFYAADFVSLVGYALLTPTLLNYLGDAQFGLLAISAAFVGYLSLLSLGLKPTLTRYVAKSHAEGNPQQLQVFMSSAAAVFVALGVVGLAGALAASRFALGFIEVPPALYAVCGAFLIVKGVQFAVALPGSVYESAVYGLDRIPEMNAVRSLVLVLEYLGMLGVVVFDLGLVALAWWSVALACLAAGMQRRVFQKTLPGVALSLRAIRWSALRELFGFSIFLAIDSIIVLLVFKTDELVIGASLGVAAVATYAVINQATQAVLALVLRISATLYPTFSQLIAAHKPEALRSTFTRAVDGALFVAGGAAVVLSAFGAELFETWLGPRETATEIIVCLAWVLVAHAPVSLASKYAAAAGLLRKITPMSVVEGLLNLALSLWWVREHGLVGVALATLLAQVSTTTWFNPWIACRDLQIAPMKFLLGRVGTFVMATTPSVLCCLALRVWLAPERPLPLLFSVALSLGVHAIASALVWRHVVLRRRFAGDIPSISSLGMDDRTE